MSKKQTNPFGDFQGTTVGEQETAKWEFPGIGYNASKGIFYIDEDQVDNVELVPLAIRQCKEVEDINGTIHRYGVKTAKARMVEGDVSYRMQMACVVDGTVYAFGARSWTARASFLNPRGGQWRDQNFDTGLWYVLEDHIRETFKNHKVATTPLCWKIQLTTGKETTVGKGKNTSTSKPIVNAAPFEFVGPEAVAANEVLYTENDLIGWVAEWDKTTTETAAEEIEPVAVEAVEETLPEDFAF